MNSKVLQLISVWAKEPVNSNKGIELDKTFNLIDEIATAENQRIAVQEKYLPRKLMRMSLVQVERAQEQLEAHGLKLAFSGAGIGALWCCVSVNPIEIGLLKERMIDLLDMPDAWHPLEPNTHKSVTGNVILEESIPSNAQNLSKEDIVLYATGMQQLGDKQANCEECSETLPSFESAHGAKLLDELCAHNLQPENCMLCQSSYKEQNR